MRNTSITTHTAVWAITIGIAALTASSPAAAAMSLGQAGNPYVVCDGPATYLQASVGQDPGYTVPAGGGVITSWSTAAVGGGAQVKLALFRPTGTPDEYTTVGTSSAETMRGSSLNAFGTRIAAQGGDVLGMLILSGAHSCVAINTGSAGDRVQRVEGALLDTGMTQVFSDPSQPERRLNIAAVLETDADGDGIGDEPPSTKLTGKPRVSHGKAKFTFESADPAATFQCKFDDGSRRRCTSPRSYPADVGAHEFSVQAVDSDGHRDPTPAKSHFVVPGRGRATTP
jgi:hypothetical protein